MASEREHDRAPKRAGAHVNQVLAWSALVPIVADLHQAVHPPEIDHQTTVGWHRPACRRGTAPTRYQRNPLRTRKLDHFNDLWLALRPDHTIGDGPSAQGPPPGWLDAIITTQCAALFEIKSRPLRRYDALQGA